MSINEKFPLLIAEINRELVARGQSELPADVKIMSNGYNIFIYTESLPVARVLTKSEASNPNPILIKMGLGGTGRDTNGIVTIPLDAPNIAVITGLKEPEIDFTKTMSAAQMAQLARQQGINLPGTGQKQSQGTPNPPTPPPTSSEKSLPPVAVASIAARFTVRDVKKGLENLIENQGFGYRELSGVGDARELRYSVLGHAQADELRVKLEKIFPGKFTLTLIDKDTVRRGGYGDHEIPQYRFTANVADLNLDEFKTIAVEAEAGVREKLEKNIPVLLGHIDIKARGLPVPGWESIPPEKVRIMSVEECSIEPIHRQTVGDLITTNFTHYQKPSPKYVMVFDLRPDGQEIARRLTSRDRGNILGGPEPKGLNLNFNHDDLVIFHCRRDNSETIAYVLLYPDVLKKLEALGQGFSKDAVDPTKRTTERQ